MTATGNSDNSFRHFVLITTCLVAVAGCSKSNEPAPLPKAASMPVPEDQPGVPTAVEPATKRALRVATPEELNQLLAAAANADDERVAQLLNDGLDINQQNADGETALMRAAMKGHNGFVETLIKDFKADPSLRNKGGKTAEEIAWDLGAAATASAIGKYLIETKSAEQKLKELLFAAANARTQHLEFLVKSAGVDINQQNADGETALMQAAANGHNGFVETLLSEYKADPNLKNKADKTAEQLAREKGHNATADAIAKHQK